MKVAFLVSRFPHPLDRGDKLRAYYQLMSMSAAHEVHLFAITDEEVTDSDKSIVGSFCKSITIHKTTTSDKISGLWRAIQSKTPFQSGLFYSKQFHKKINEKIEKLGIDLVYCQLIRMAMYCEELKPKKVIDYMDAFSLGMEKRARLSNFLVKKLYEHEALRVKKYEQYCLGLFDEYIFISQEDKNAIVPADITRGKVIKNGIDTSKFFPIPTLVKKYDVGFIGNLGYLPNIDAVKIILEEIVPNYEKKYGKKLKVLVAGARTSDEIKKFQSSSVDVVGWIDDINAAYNTIKILVAPIYNGTGLQNKVLEAMACGVAVLCNTEVNNSIGAEADKEIATALKRSLFADEIYNLLQSPDRLELLAKNGQLFVAQNYAWTHINHDLV